MSLENQRVSAILPSGTAIGRLAASRDVLPGQGRSMKKVRAVKKTRFLADVLNAGRMGGEGHDDTLREIAKYIDDQAQLVRLKRIVLLEMKKHEISVNQFAQKNHHIKCCCQFCTDARKEEL